MRSYTLYCILIILILFVFVYFRDYKQKNKENFYTTTESTKTTEPPYDSTNKLIKYNIETEQQGDSLDYMTIDNFYSFKDDTSVIFFSPTADDYTIKFFLKIDDNADGFQHIVNSRILNDNDPVWSLKYNDGFFYLQLGDNVNDKQTNYRFKINYGTVQIKDTIVLITISYTPNKNNVKQLVCAIHGEIITLKTKSDIPSTTSSTSTTSKQVVIFGSNSSDIIDISSVATTGSPSPSTFKFQIGDIYVEENKFYNETELTKLMDENYIPCKFIPIENEDESECRTKCITNNNCDRYSCTKICNTKGQKELAPIRREPEPDAPSKIRVISKTNGFIIEFRKPEYEGSDNSVINHYIVIAQKHDSKDNDTKLYTVHATQDNNCRYEIDGLDTDTFYDISVLSKNNKNSISKNASEIETETTLPIEDNKLLKSHNNNYDALCYEDSNKYRFNSGELDSTEVKTFYKNNQNLETHLNAIYHKTSVEAPILSNKSSYDKTGAAVLELDSLNKYLGIIN